MLLGRRLGRSTYDRLQEILVQGELGVDVSSDEHFAGVAAQAAKVDVLGEGACDVALDISLEKVGYGN